MSGENDQSGGIQTLQETNRLLAAIQQTLSSLVTSFAPFGPGTTPLHYQSAASTNATSVTAVPSVLHNLNVENTTATIYYLKFYDKASAPTVGTDLPVATFAIKASDRTAPVLPAGMKFLLGCAFALTSGAPNADTGVAAIGVHINLGLST